ISRNPLGMGRISRRISARNVSEAPLAATSCVTALELPVCGMQPQGACNFDITAPQIAPRPTPRITPASELLGGLFACLVRPCGRRGRIELEATSDRTFRQRLMHRCKSLVPLAKIINLPEVFFHIKKLVTSVGKSNDAIVALSNGDIAFIE